MCPSSLLSPFSKGGAHWLVLANGLEAERTSSLLGQSLQEHVFGFQEVQLYLNWQSLQQPGSLWDTVGSGPCSSALEKETEWEINSAVLNRWNSGVNVLGVNVLSSHSIACPGKHKGDCWFWDTELILGFQVYETLQWLYSRDFCKVYYCIKP